MVCPAMGVGHGMLEKVSMKLWLGIWSFVCRILFADAYLVGMMRPLCADCSRCAGPYEQFDG